MSYPITIKGKLSAKFRAFDGPIKRQAIDNRPVVPIIKALGATLFGMYWIAILVGR
jgi:hypothetical protein